MIDRAFIFRHFWKENEVRGNFLLEKVVEVRSVSKRG